jgi:DNA modification methylase
VIRILQGNCREVLRTLPDESVHCVVTSPPYFGLRDYGVAGQIGLEPTPEAYVAELVAVFREVRRVLRKDGTCWLNLGDSYGGSNMTGGTNSKEIGRRESRMIANRNMSSNYGLKPKDLIGIPWSVALALRADGWWLRQDIIWSKPNPMPESVTDRCTKAHEYIFLLTKSERYYYDAAAIAEKLSFEPHVPGNIKLDESRNDRDQMGKVWGANGTRNKRSVWTVATQPYSEAHFATFPPKLIEPCILAGCPAKCCAKCGAPWVREVERVDTGRTQKMADGWDTGNGAHGTIHRNGREQGAPGIPVMANKTLGFSSSCSCEAGTVAGTVLDCFGGAGTTGLVADRLQRNAILIELNAEYAAMAERRCFDDAPLFAEAAE